MKDEISKRNQKNLIVGNVTTTFGNKIFDYANSILIRNISPNSLTFMAIYQNAEIIIHALLNIIGGSFGDRYNKKNILVITDILSGFVCLIFYFFYRSELVIYALLIANMLLAIISSFNYPIYMSIPRSCITESKIKAYNSSLVSWREISKLLGPIIGLVIVNYLNISIAYIFNIISFFVSAYLQSKIVIINPVDKTKDKTKKSISIYSSIVEGIKYLKSSDYLYKLVLLSITVNFFLSGYNLMLPYTNIHFKGIDNFYGLFLTAEACGAIFAGVINPKIKKEFNISMNLLLCGIFLFLFDFISRLNTLVGIILLLLTIFMFGFFLALFNINFATMVQSKTEQEYISRVWSLIGTVALISMPIGAIFFSYIYSKNIGCIFSIIGIGIVFSSFIFVFFNMRGKRYNK